jgi:hypothetical protein
LESEKGRARGGEREGESESVTSGDEEEGLAGGPPPLRGRKGKEGKGE